MHLASRAVANVGAADHERDDPGEQRQGHAHRAAKRERRRHHQPAGQGAGGTELQRQDAPHRQPHDIDGVVVGQQPIAGSAGGFGPLLMTRGSQSLGTAAVTGQERSVAREAARSQGLGGTAHLVRRSRQPVQAEHRGASLVDRTELERGRIDARALSHRAGLDLPLPPPDIPRPAARRACAPLAHSPRTRPRHHATPTAAASA